MPIKSGSPPPPARSRKDKYQLLIEDYRQVRDELASARDFIANHDPELRKIKAELTKANHLIDRLQQQLKDAKIFSKFYEEKAIGAQADKISISKVGEKVAALNAEIFQAADTLGEAIIYECRALSLIEMDDAAASSRVMVGEKMTNVLITQSQNPEPKINPLLLQVVLRIFMVKFCVVKIKSWHPDRDNSAAGEFLSAIYSKIRSTEEQAVSGRWRALTRAHTARPSTEAWKKEFYQSLQPVLMIASWGIRSSEFFDRRLPSFFKAINEFRIAVGENFTSADLIIISFESDKIYDPEIMKDAYSDGKQPESPSRLLSASGKRASEVIVGTTGIGLGKFIAEAKDGLHWEFQSLIPAKIVLWSTVNKSLGPIQEKPVEITDGANQDGRD